MAEPTSEMVVLAGNLRCFLSQRSWRYDDLAEEMVARGFDWTANTVAQVVTLRRRVELLELAGLCNVFRCTLYDLIRSDGPFLLPSGRVTAAGVCQALSGCPTNFEVDEPSPLGPSAAERKAMRSLGMSVEALRAASLALFGTDSIEAERDRRVGATGDARSLQALRGHAMRAVLAELAA